MEASPEGKATLASPEEKLASALQSLVTPFGISLLQSLTGAGKQRVASSLDGQDVKCANGHECTRLTESPPEYYPGPIWCNLCSDNGIEATYGSFYHCTTCQWDACPPCACGEKPVCLNNVWTSPISVALCMSMVACGATHDSTTQKELRRVLGHEALGQEAHVLAACLRIIDSISTDGSNGAEVACANGAWVHGVGMARGYCRDDYVASVNAFFNAKVEPMPSDPGPINDWVKCITRGKIEQILTDLNPLASMILVNAIYFKGEWARKFERGATSQKEFYRLDGTKMCQMMSQEDTKMQYMHGNLSGSEVAIQACRLRYGSSPFSAVVVLPSNWGLTAIHKMQLALSVQSWADLMVQLSVAKSHVRLQLPRFKLDSGLMNLNETLKQLGIHAAWEGGFDRMSQHHVQLQDVFHRAICEVDEEGTVAAAATAAVMGKGYGKKAEPTQMECNRPFLFAIVHDLSGAPLLWGIVVDP